VDARTSAQNVTIFNEFTLGNAVNVSTFDGSEITIIAYAIQADGFATPQLAWAAAPTWN